MRIRATTRLRNNDMVSARERLGLSVHDVARLSGVALNTVYDYEKLNYSGKRPKTIEQHADAIGMVLGIPSDLVAPRALWGCELPNTHVSVRDVDPGMLLDAVEIRNVRTCLPSPDMEIEAGETKDAIEAAINTLSCREQEIIKLRYGMKDGRPYTLGEVGDVLKISRERVRILEAVAVEKLRRSRSIKDCALHTK